jgi:hypothetical protein
MFDQLKNLKNIASLMGNASELREKFQQLQDELAQKRIEAQAGAGAVRVVVNGKFELVSVHLDPPLITALAGQGSDADKEMIEELIVSATNEALRRAQTVAREELARLTGGMNIPGLDNLLG